MEWYTKAAEQGLSGAQNALGKLYTKLNDDEKAVEWFKKAAYLGDSFGKYNLGACYMVGKGVPQDLDKAKELFTDAAEDGNSMAQYGLGVYYDSIGDDKTAVEWFTKSAEQGYADAQSKLESLK